MCIGKEGDRGLDIIISNSGGQPIYDQISAQIKSKIISGELKEGDALPSIRFLAKELRISVITTKRAYEELERDGFIVSVPGTAKVNALRARKLATVLWSASRFSATMSSAQMPPQAIIITSTESSSL